MASNINIGDSVITNLNIKTSPIHNVNGIVVEIIGNDYLLDMSPNGVEFVNRWKKLGLLYGYDWNKDIPNTCKWFEKKQLIINKNNVK